MRNKDSDTLTGASYRQHSRSVKHIQTHGNLGGKGSRAVSCSDIAQFILMLPFPLYLRSSARPERIFGGADPRRAGDGEPPRRRDMLGRCVLDANAGTNQNALRFWPVQYLQPTWEGKQDIAWVKMDKSSAPVVSGHGGGQSSIPGV